MVTMGSAHTLGTCMRSPEEASALGVQQAPACWRAAAGAPHTAGTLASPAAGPR